MIVGAQAAVAGQVGPIVDGTVVPRDPFNPDAPAVSADVPLMGGSNLDDSGLNRTDFSIDDAAAQQQLTSTLGDNRASSVNSAAFWTSNVPNVRASTGLGAALAASYSAAGNWK